MDHDVRRLVGSLRIWVISDAYTTHPKRGERLVEVIDNKADFEDAVNGNGTASRGLDRA